MIVLILGPAGPFVSPKGPRTQESCISPKPVLQVLSPKPRNSIICHIVPKLYIHLDTSIEYVMPVRGSPLPMVSPFQCRKSVHSHRDGVCRGYHIRNCHIVVVLDASKLPSCLLSSLLAPRTFVRVSKVPTVTEIRVVLLAALATVFGSN